MEKKRIGSIIMGILIIIIVGTRLYRKYDREERQKEIQEANKELYLKAQKHQRELEYKAQQAAEQAKRDSIFAAQKKERDAKMQQLQENIKKLEAEQKEQQ